MINDKTISPKKSKTIAFVFPSLMASFKNEILMGMAHYAQKPFPGLRRSFAPRFHAKHI